VGYTNAGKSTLFNKLSGADVLAKDMPFATLDPTIRHVELPNIGSVAFVDTVGFITELPTHLIDSFKATLEEVLEADLLVHVRDRSVSSDVSNHRDVLLVLQQLEASNNSKLPPIIEAWNKADLLSEDQFASLSANATHGEEMDSILVSSTHGTGLEELVDCIEVRLSPNRKRYNLQLLPSEGRARAWLHQHALVLEEHSDIEGFSITAEMDAETEAIWQNNFGRD